MTLAAAAGLLSCPQCHGTLDLATPVGCAQGHRFDVARQGYLNLLGRPQPQHADSAQMVAARQRVFAAGVFDPVAAAVVRAAGGCRRILDAGGGPGWYAQRLLDAQPGAVGVSLDISIAATRAAARAHQRLAAVVADTWAGLPLLADSVDLVLAIFAPRNVAEFARVLTGSGRLVVVTPNPGHLAGLRAAHRLLAIQADKDERLDEALGSHFSTEASERIQDEVGGSAALVADVILTLFAVESCVRAVGGSAALVADVIGMGPNAFHQRAAPTNPALLEIDVTVRTLRRR